MAATALALTSVVRELWQYYLVYGFVLAVGYSFASPFTVTPMVSRWFTKKRTLALSVGYKSADAFSRAFRRHFGIAPSAYRERFSSAAPD